MNYPVAGRGVVHSAAFAKCESKLSRLAHCYARITKRGRKMDDGGNKLTILYNDRSGGNITGRFSAIIEKTARQVLKLEGIDLYIEISVSFVNSAEIKLINNKFRRIDKATDVLSFPLVDFRNGTRGLSRDEIHEIGDIIISVEKAEEQAEKYGHSMEREIAFLTAHSVLHLLGYDHMDEDEEKIMFSKQEDALNNIGLPR